MKAKHLDVIADMICLMFKYCNISDDDKKRITNIAVEQLSTTNKRFNRHKFISKIK
jgi:hypothetical protein